MRLVLCDDNRIFCEALAVALEARGHQALAIATTADEGVAAVAGCENACIPGRCAVARGRPDRVTELLVKERHASMVWPVLAG